MENIRFWKKNESESNEKIKFRETSADKKWVKMFIVLENSISS